MNSDLIIDLSHGMDARMGLSLSASDLQTLIDAVRYAAKANPGVVSWNRMLEGLEKAQDVPKVKA